MSQAPEVGCDVLPQAGLGAGQLDESDGGLVLIVVPALYHWPRDAILSKAAGRQTARLSAEAGQLVIAGGGGAELASGGGGGGLTYLSLL